MVRMLAVPCTWIPKCAELWTCNTNKAVSLAVLGLCELELCYKGGASPAPTQSQQRFLEKQRGRGRRKWGERRVADGDY